MHSIVLRKLGSTMEANLLVTSVLLETRRRLQARIIGGNFNDTRVPYRSVRLHQACSISASLYEHFH